MTHARKALVAVFLAFSLGAPLTRAQGGADRNPPVYSNEVSLVLLPVFAADGQGRAVRGLQAKDFTVQADGKEVELVSFRYIDTTSEEDQEEIRESPAARRRFLLLFDASFTDPAGLKQAQRATLTFLRTTLSRSDLAAVATVDANRGLKLVANFTDDRGLLAHAVQTLGLSTLARVSDPLGLAADLAATDIALPGQASDSVSVDATITSSLSVLVRQMRQADEASYRSQVNTLMGGFEDLARGLRNVEGRKQVLYFSAGFDSRVLVGEEGNDQKEASRSIVEGRLWEVDGQSRYGDMRVREALRAALRNLANADTVVHSIDVTGLGADDALTRQVSRQDPQRAVSGRESLNMIASETGGRFFKDTHDLGAVLREMADMTSRYYVLGFQPAGAKGPGAYHKVKVKLARRGAHLSHRAGYYERMPVASQTTLQRQFEAAQLVMTGVGPNNIAFSALCFPFPAAGPEQPLGVVVQVPKEALPWGDGQASAVEVYGYGVAEDGTVVDHFAQLVRINPREADPDGVSRGISLFGTLNLQPGRYTVRLMVREQESGTSGVQFLEVNVPPRDPSRGFLLPPMAVDDPGSWLTVEVGKARSGHAARPFEMDGQPFVPRATFQLKSGQAQRVVLIAYEPTRRTDPTNDIQIRSSLTDQDGKQVPAGFLRVQKVLHDGEGRRTYVLGYTPEVSLPGDYTLRVGVGEAGSRLESYTRLKMVPGS
jgi:VWFA-related protein